MGQQIFNFDFKSEMDNSQVRKSISEIRADLDKIVNSNALRTMDKDAINVTNSVKQVAYELDSVTSKLEDARNVKIPTQEYTELQQTIKSVENALGRTINEQDRLVDKLNRNPVVQDYIQTKNAIEESNKALEIATRTYGKQSTEAGAVTAQLHQHLSHLEHIQEKAESLIYPVNQLERKINDQRVDLQQLNTEAERLVQTGKAYTLGDPAQIEKYSHQQQVLADKAEVLIQKDDEIKRKEAEIAQEEARRLAKLIEINQNAGQMNPELSKTVGRLKEIETELNALVARQRDLEAAGRGLGYNEYDENLGKIRQLQNEQQTLLGQVDDYRDAQSGATEEVTQTVSATETLKNVWVAIVDVIKSGINVIQQVLTAVNNVINAVKKLLQHIKDTNNETSKSSNHWQKTLWTIAKALIGVRGLYMLIRKIRKAIVEGYKNLAKESLEAASSLNLLSAKFMQLKNSVGAAIAPLVSMVAPVIERIIDLFTRAFNAVAMFFGALSGKKTVMVAKTLGESEGAAINAGSSSGSNKKTPEQKYQDAVDKAQAKYEKELAKYQDKVAKAEAKQAKAAAKLAKEQEKVNKQLQGFDELNNLTQDEVDDTTDALEDYMAGIEEPELEMPDMADYLGGGGGGGLGDMFEEVEIDSGISDFADKIASIFKDLFKPIKQAWDDVGDFLIDSWKKAWTSIKNLAKDFWRDFIDIWTQEKTVQIFRDIFTIIGDIGLILSTIVDKIRDAWNFNQLGYKILTHIRDIIATIVGWIRKAADYTVGWAKTLDFVPLFSSIERFLNALQPVVENVMGVLYDFYTTVLLPLGQWVLEKGLPTLFDILSQLLEDIDWDKLREDLKGLWEHLEPFAERVGEGLLDFIAGLAQELADWVNSGKFEEFLDKVEKWMDDVSAEDVKNLADDLFWFVRVIGKFIEVVADTAAAIGVENLAKMAAAVGTFKLLNVGGIASGLLSFGGSLVKLWGTLKIGKLLFGAKTTTEITSAATTAGTAAGTAAGEATVTATTTAIEGGTAAIGISTGAILGTLSAGIVAGLGVLKVTGEKYAEDMRETLNPHEIAVYGDTIANIGEKFKETADTIIGKASEIKDKSTESLGSLSDYTRSYTEASTLQKQAVENANDAFWKQQNALKQLDEALTRESDEIYRTGIVSDETRVKIDNARTAVETTTQAYEDAKGALEEANTTMEFVKGQYDALPDSAKNAVGGIDDVDIAMQRVNESAKSYADQQAQIQIANNNLQGSYTELASTTAEEQAKIEMANNNLIGNYSDLADTATETVNSLSDNVELAEQAGEDTMKGYVTGIENQSKTLQPKMKTVGLESMTGLKKGTSEKKSEVINEYTTTTQSIIDIVKNLLGIHSPSTVFSDIGANTMEGLLNGFKSLKSTIMSWISGFIDGMVSKFQSLGGKISDVMSGVVGAVSSTLSNIGDSISGAVNSWKESIAGMDVGTEIQTKVQTKTKIPKHATGQVIPPNMKEYLAILGDNNKETEVVSPLSTMKQAFTEALAEGNFRGSGDNGDIVIQIDGYEVFRAVRHQNDIFRKSTGSNAFA